MVIASIPYRESPRRNSVLGGISPPNTLNHNTVYNPLTKVRIRQDTVFCGLKKRLPHSVNGYSFFYSLKTLKTMNPSIFISELLDGTHTPTTTIANPFAMKVPTLLVCDCSSSMAGEPIDQLNNGLVNFKNYLLQDSVAQKAAEVGIIKFSDQPNFSQPFTDVNQWQVQSLVANGGTGMGAALTMAIQEIEHFKTTLKSQGVSYYRPLLLLITDGQPTDMRNGDATWSSLKGQIQSHIQSKKLLVYAFGTETADFAALENLVGKENTFRLHNLNFNGLFKWVSNSIALGEFAHPVLSTELGG